VYLLVDVYHHRRQHLRDAPCSRPFSPVNLQPSREVHTLEMREVRLVTVTGSLSGTFGLENLDLDIKGRLLRVTHGTSSSSPKCVAQNLASFVVCELWVMYVLKARGECLVLTCHASRADFNTTLPNPDVPVHNYRKYEFTDVSPTFHPRRLARSLS
jgi:hypothetical protein